MFPGHSINQFTCQGQLTSLHPSLQSGEICFFMLFFGFDFVRNLNGKPSILSFLYNSKLLMYLT